LYNIWEERGGAWADDAAQEASAGQQDAADPVPELSPQQMQLVQEHFDRVTASLVKPQLDIPFLV
jgi:hypothetical protein